MQNKGRLTVPQARKCLWGLALYTGQGGVTEQGLGVLQDSGVLEDKRGLTCKRADKVMAKGSYRTVES